MTKVDHSKPVAFEIQNSGGYYTRRTYPNLARALGAFVRDQKDGGYFKSDLCRVSVQPVGYELVWDDATKTGRLMWFDNAQGDFVKLLEKTLK